MVGVSGGCGPITACSASRAQTLKARSAHADGAEKLVIDHNRQPARSDEDVVIVAGVELTLVARIVRFNSSWLGVWVTITACAFMIAASSWR